MQPGRPPPSQESALRPERLSAQVSPAGGGAPARVTPAGADPHPANKDAEPGEGPGTRAEGVSAEASALLQGHSHGPPGCEAKEERGGQPLSAEPRSLRFLLLSPSPRTALRWQQQCWLQSCLSALREAGTEGLQDACPAIREAGGGTAASRPPPDHQSSWQVTWIHVFQVDPVPPVTPPVCPRPSQHHPGTCYQCKFSAHPAP